MVCLMMFPKPGPRKKKRLKYGNTIIRDPVTGKKAYDSKLERNYHGHLILRERAGEIEDLQQWPSVELLPGIRYKPDFFYRECRTKREIWVDTKGVIGERYRIIVKLWRLFGPGVLMEVRAKGAGWIKKEYKSDFRELK